MRPLTALLLLGISISVHSQGTPNPETLTERSQASARAVIDRAISALGGVELLKAIHTVRYQSEGESWDRLQMPTLQPPFEPLAQQLTALLDLQSGRARFDVHDRSAGIEVRTSTVIDRGSAMQYDHRRRTAYPISMSQAVQQSSLYNRRLPQLLLLQALQSAGTMRHLGRDEGAGRPQEVITYVTPQGEQVSLYIDASSNLISKGESLYVDPLSGDEAAEFAFTDYTRSGKHLVPQTFLTHDAGARTGKSRVRVELNPAVSASSFEVPHAGYVEIGAPPALAEAVERLADGVFVMQNIAGPNQHSLAVAFDDHILVVEAPGSSAGADKLIARIKETIPGKPIRYVAITHHHGDHVGGLRSFIAEGATVITTPGNREYIEALAKAPVFDRLREQPRAPDIRIIRNGKHLLSDASRTVELIDIGPNPHATELVVAYLPRERVLFEADVFVSPYVKRPLTPPLAHTASFAKRVRELGLKVDWIVGVHGRITSAAEFSEVTKLEL